LPEIRSSSETYGEVQGTAIRGVPISDILGDQQAALFDQTCFDPGSAKNTSAPVPSCWSTPTRRSSTPTSS